MRMPQKHNAQQDNDDTPSSLLYDDCHKDFETSPHGFNKNPPKQEMLKQPKNEPAKRPQRTQPHSYNRIPKANKMISQMEHAFGAQGFLETDSSNFWAGIAAGFLLGFWAFCILCFYDNKHFKKGVIIGFVLFMVLMIIIIVVTVVVVTQHANK